MRRDFLNKLAQMLAVEETEEEKERWEHVEGLRTAELARKRRPALLRRRARNKLARRSRNKNR